MNAKESINFHDLTKESIKEHNQNWPQIPDHSSKILIVGSSNSGLDSEAEYQLLNNKQERTA